MQELRIASAVARDVAMLDVFKLERDNPNLIREDTGETYANPECDLHFVATSAMYPHLLDLPPWEQMAEAKRPQEDGVSYRHRGKVFNFSIIYGAQAASLAGDLGVTPEEAEKYQERYFSKFWGLGRWLKSTAEFAKTQRWVRNAYGRKIFCNESNAKGIDDANAVARKGPNAVIQGTGADMMKLALIYVEDELGPDDRIVAVVHDEMNVLLKGKCWVESETVDDKGYTKHKFGVDEETKDRARRLMSCMTRAEDDILSPLIDEPFPCAADMQLGKYWIH